MLLVVLGLLGALSLPGATATEEQFLLPCRAWRWPCFDQPWRCSTEEDYQRFITGPQPDCPIYYDPNDTNTPPGDCVVIDGVCNFTESAVSCQSWLPLCDYSYRCGTELEYAQYVNETALIDVDCSFIGDVPPPEAVCTSINGSCQWYNPCRTWNDMHCSNDLMCGSHSDY